MLLLKNVLLKIKIPQARLAKDVNLSAATIAQLLNKELWPVTPTREDLTESIKGALRKYKLGAEAENPALFETVRPFTKVAHSENNLNEQAITMLLRKTTLSQAAKQNFKLFRDPFLNDVQEVTDVFTAPNILSVREYLYATAKHGGFVAVIGESGAGKSTLRRDLADRIYREAAPIMLIEPMVLGMEDNDVKGKTLKATSIADAIIYTVAPNEKPKASTEAKYRQVQRVLMESYRAGHTHCLIIEEAHGLAVPTLKHLKRFFELELGLKKLLSIVLIGQTELKTKLSERSPEVREVVQRCEVIELTPLDAHLESYLRFKFERVGKQLSDIFEKDAMDGIRDRLIFTKSDKKGCDSVSLMYPLMVNNLVTAAMNSAVNLGFDKVSADIIREA